MSCLGLENDLNLASVSKHLYQNVRSLVEALCIVTIWFVTLIGSKINTALSWHLERRCPHSHCHSLDPFIRDLYFLFILYSLEVSC